MKQIVYESMTGWELETEDWDRMDEEEQSEETERLVTRLKEKGKQRLTGVRRRLTCT